MSGDQQINNQIYHVTKASQWGTTFAGEIELFSIQVSCSWSLTINILHYWAGVNA